MSIPSKTETDILLEWIPACQYFLIKSKEGDLALQEIAETTELFKFFSCLGVLIKFPNRNKEVPQHYKVTIEHIINEDK